MDYEIGKVLAAIAVVVILTVVARVYYAVVVKPMRIRRRLMRQGIRGPSPKFLFGNIMEIRKARKAAAAAVKLPGGPPVTHDCEAATLPFFGPWKKRYGDLLLFSLGNVQILLANDPEIVREITTTTSLGMGKPAYQANELRPLLGEGILTSNGPYWKYQRDVLAPELYMDKVKGMFNLIIESSMILINSWNNLIKVGGGIAEITIDDYLRSFSGDVISRACFGSNFSKGEEIFKYLRALQDSTSKKVLSTGIPGMRYLPTKVNREGWALEEEIKKLILEVVKGRSEEGNEKNILQMILQTAKQSNLGQAGIDKFIVDNCKNIYLAGYETTAVSAMWCLMLLAAYPEWQDRVRAEVVEICQGKTPDGEMIRKMKQLTMVINETLRLYPPVPVVSRESYEDMKLGGYDIPKRVNLWALVTTLHTDPKIWGPDSYKFNPSRFANGITESCKQPHVYMPFGRGPRICLGINLVLVELKILISLILANFSFSISPEYIHSPTFTLVIKPEHGVKLVMKKL